MRSWVFFSPQRDTKASRSRSRMYCSLTSCGEVSGPPARMFASLRPTCASYSEAYLPRSMMWMAWLAADFIRWHTVYVGLIWHKSSAGPHSVRHLLPLESHAVGED